MTTVVLAEKPDQGRKFANALGKTQNKDGHIKVDSDLFNQEVIVTWGIGHLVGLSTPDKYDEKYKKWSFDHLPILPDQMKYEVNLKTSKQFKIVKQLLQQASEIIIATDPDREGENIAYSIFKLSGKDVWQKPKKRLWINSLQKNEIVRGFKHLKDSSETYNYFKEAETRQISDWLVGMNYSPFLSLHMQNKGLNGIWSVGRVQTPTNTLICENYLERENFKAQPYWLLRGLSKNNDDEVKFAHDIKDNQFFDKEALNQYIENYQLNQCNQAIVSNIETSQKQKESPKLFSLGALQSYCSNKFGWTASQTLKEIQTLYDKGYISYPRTSSQFITQNEFSYLNTKKEDYKALLGLSVEFTQTNPRKRYVNDEKVLEHYAIIPTDELPNLSDLSSNSQKLYEVIVRNTLAMFCDNHEYEETVIHVMANKVPFKTKGVVVLNHGWRSIISEDSDKKDHEAKELPAYQVDQSIPFRVVVEDKMTKPPAQITEAKLVGENGLMKKLGLGTEATRSGIIETLKERQYIQNDGKTKLKPTTKGLLLYESTKNSLIGSPEMTAKWEERLETIGKGESAPENFIAQIKSSIEPTFEKIQSQELPVHYIEQLSDNQSFKVGKYTVLEKNKLFEATPDDESEVVLLWKSIAGAKLTKKEVEELLTNGKTKTKKKGLKSKKGKSFSAYLLLDNGKVSFAFE